MAVNEYTSLYIFHGKLVPVLGKKFASLFTKLGEGLGPNSLTPYLSNFSAGSFKGAEKPKSMSEKEALIEINFLGLDGERAKILSVYASPSYKNFSHFCFVTKRLQSAFSSAI